MIRAEVCWHSGVTSPIEVPKYLFSAAHRFHRITELARELPDEQITQALGAAGLETVKGRPWSARRVMHFRLSNGIPSGFPVAPHLRILRQMVRLRKQLAERTLLAIREACHKVETGEAILPYHFQHTDTLPEVSRDARTVAEVRVLGREVTMNWILWDKRTWVTKHPDLYGSDSVEHARNGTGSYTEQLNRFFVQFDGTFRDCLWFGDLVEQRVFKHFAKWQGAAGSEPEDYQARWAYARACGFTDGCICNTPGLLDSGDRWCSVQEERGKDLLLDFESLYHGILFGSALAMLALSNGSRISELLQISMNKERRITRTETVLLLGEDGQPQVDEHGQPLTRQVKLHFQYLLPKGAKTDEERQLFPLSKEALRYLVIWLRICGRGNASDRLVQKEDQGHANGAKDLHTRV